MIDAPRERSHQHGHPRTTPECDYPTRWRETMQRVMSTLSPEAAEVIVTDFVQSRSGVDKHAVRDARAAYALSIDRKWFAFAAESLPAGPEACLHWCALVAARLTSTEWLGIPDSGYPSRTYR